ncbi:DUF2958 domain-containing protein [Dyadobacter bucti]|uniref:DUF2958 domain-containing protein n=1 Tax=Dyadobacter bucti TaxID=2572203 RepID=UPI001109D34E|nr:DUF2958 domain-containing protein [Dyadobacter bucti]
MSRLYTPEEEAKLRENGKRSESQDIDPVPVVKLFATNGRAIWLLTELSPFYEGMAFGLCDLGMGCPELGDVYLPELEEIKQRNTGLPAVERDDNFSPEHPLSIFTEAARLFGQITEDQVELRAFSKTINPRNIS